MFKDWGDCVKNGAATIGCIPVVFSNFLTALLMFAGLFALSIFIYAGYKYINSAGDPKKLEGARNTLIYGIVGLIVIIFSFFIIRLIATFTGVDCITKFGFNCK